MEMQRWEMPSEVLAVHREIETWRNSRDKRGRIPSSIWLAASVLARRYSVHRIAQALHLNYGALKRRLLESSNTDEATGPSQEPNESQGIKFVELTGVNRITESRTTAARGGKGKGFQLEIEVSDGHGSQMTVRVLESAGVDVSQIVREFCGRSQ